MRSRQAHGLYRSSNQTGFKGNLQRMDIRKAGMRDVVLWRQPPAPYPKSLQKQFLQRRKAGTKVGDPNGGVHQDHSGILVTPSANRTQSRLGPAQSGEASIALLSDERLEPVVNESRLFPDPGQGRRFFEDRVIKIQSHSHMYEYAFVKETTFTRISWGRRGCRG